MNNKELNIGVDIDGVISDFALRFSEICREIYGTHLPLINDMTMIKDWNWHTWYPITKEEERKVWNRIVNHELNFWETMPIINNNDWESIKELQFHDSINVYFITTRSITPGKTVMKQTVSWFKKHGWDNAQVIRTKSKEQFIKFLDIKFFVDDKKENCEDVKKENPDCRVYVFDTPYNRSLNDKELDIRRIISLNEFLVDVLEYARR